MHTHVRECAYETPIPMATPFKPLTRNPTYQKTTQNTQFSHVKPPAAKSTSDATTKRALQAFSRRIEEADVQRFTCNLSSLATDLITAKCRSRVTSLTPSLTDMAANTTSSAGTRLPRSKSFADQTRA